VNSASGDLQPAQIRRFAKLGINFLRINLCRDESWPKTAAVPEDRPLLNIQKGLRRLRLIFAACKKYDIHIMLCCCSIRGRTNASATPEEIQAFGDRLVRFWKAFGTEFRNEDIIVAYDILGEPHFNNVKAWQAQRDRAIKAIREINPRIWLVVEPCPWGLSSNYKHFQPVDDPYVIYDVQFYDPHSYTHQRVHPPAKDLTEGQLAYLKGKLDYPGDLRMFPGSPTERWDKDKLRERLKPLRDFQKKHKVRVLVGEFGVIRWAPGRAKWLSDAIGVFEGFGWDWVFHTIVGWNGWNPTFGSNDHSTCEPNGYRDTERFKILKGAWRRNKRPPLPQEDSE